METKRNVYYFGEEKRISVEYIYDGESVVWMDYYIKDMGKDEIEFYRSDLSLKDRISYEMDVNSKEELMVKWDEIFGRIKEEYIEG